MTLLADRRRGRTGRGMRPLTCSLLLTAVLAAGCSLPANEPAPAPTDQAPYEPSDTRILGPDDEVGEAMTDSDGRKWVTVPLTDSGPPPVAGVRSGDLAVDVCHPRVGWALSALLNDPDVKARATDPGHDDVSCLWRRSDRLGADPTVSIRRWELDELRPHADATFHAGGATTVTDDARTFPDTYRYVTDDGAYAEVWAEAGGAAWQVTCDAGALGRCDPMVLDLVVVQGLFGWLFDDLPDPWRAQEAAGRR